MTMKVVTPEDVIPKDRVPSEEEIESQTKTIDSNLRNNGDRIKQGHVVKMQHIGMYKELAYVLVDLYKQAGWDVEFDSTLRESTWYVLGKRPPRPRTPDDIFPDITPWPNRERWVPKLPSPFDTPRPWPRRDIFWCNIR